MMALSITAMDKTNTLEVNDPAKFCHLRRLPDDIKRYIAHLAFEWDQKKFVERTRIQEQ